MQRHPSLRAVNLNLIPILRALLKEVSVTRAGKSLSLSTSATSGALAELRVLLDDPLLVRVGRSLRLTRRSEELIGAVEEACVALENILQLSAFTPAKAERSFVVATPDYVSFLLSQPLTEALRAQAPGISVRFVDVPGDLEKQLAFGVIDLGIADVSHWDWSGVSTSGSFMDRLVGVVDRHHPLAGTAPDSVALARYACIQWDPGLDLGARVAELGLVLPLVGPITNVLSQRFTSMPLLAVESDLVAIVPKALADRLIRILPITLIELPFERFAIETAVIWSTAQESDAAHRWFRALTAQALGTVMGGEGSAA